MKILILTHRIPYPLRDGGAIAMNQSIQGYLDLGYEVSVLAMNTAKHWVEPDSLPGMYQKLHRFETVYVNNSINPIAAFFNLFSDKSYHVDRFINKPFNETLQKLLKEEVFDIIQFESIYTSPYLDTVRQLSNAPCIARLHNIEHHIWQYLSEHESNFLKRKYLQLLTQRLKQYEYKVLKAFDLLLPISPKEQAFLQDEGFDKTYYFPFGIEIPEELPDVIFEPNSCYHLGSMDWPPNIEGVTWFLNDVWQKCADTLPRVHVYIAGKNMSPSMRKHDNERVHVVGEVDDFIRFSLEKNILVIPLQSGGGIRIKMLEAMALGKTIIATGKGAEGIEGISGKHFLLANSADEFSEALRFCFTSPQAAQVIGEAAKEWVSLHFNKQQLFAALNLRLHELVYSQ